MERTDRIAAEMKRVVSDIIRTELKDPRIPVVTSVTRLKLAKDLKFAKIYVSFYGSEADKKGAMQALKASAGLIRYQIGQKMTIRALPELTFALDESIEYGSYRSERFSQVRAEDKMKARRNDRMPDAGYCLSVTGCQIISTVRVSPSLSDTGTNRSPEPQRIYHVPPFSAVSVTLAAFLFFHSHETSSVPGALKCLNEPDCQLSGSAPSSVI